MDDKSRLIKEARLVQQRARAPYSGYQVGAAILTGSGEIYPGCNIESDAFPTTICAERVAIFAAIAAGANSFKALAIATHDGGMPCGSCRQVIYEQCGEIPIYIINLDSSTQQEFTTSQLLPYPFDFRQK